MRKTMDEIAGELLSAMAHMGKESQGPAQFAIGEVLAGGRAGLKVSCGGQELTGEDIWINADLLEDFCPKLVGTLPGSCPDGSTVTKVAVDQLTRGEFGLKAGDRVALFTLDQQDYYLVARLVKL